MKGVAVRGNELEPHQLQRKDAIYVGAGCGTHCLLPIIQHPAMPAHIAGCKAVRKRWALL
ncbi:hypothetical protein EON66_11320 [archaeon]|nr:MAG: hypothetical protein EON66_11320 [archaeon]